MVEVTASLGSNIEPKLNLTAAINSLQAVFPNLQASPAYQSPPIGFEGPDFLNLVVAFKTCLPFPELRERLHAIEEAHERVRNGTRLSDRTLDIDILTYGDTVGEMSGVTLPRSDITRFAFVLKPLADLRPKGCHPRLKVSYAELWRTFPEKDKQPLKKLAIL